MRTTVLCQHGSDNNYRTKPTSAWALVANGMNFELLFTTEVIPPSSWVSSGRCKRGLGKEGQSIPSTTQWWHYNISRSPPETLFKGQRTRLGNTAFHLPPTYLRVNIYCIFLFQMGGNLECIRFCIYDSTASPFVPVFLLFHSNPAPFLLCNQLSYLFRPLGMFSFMT